MWHIIKQKYNVISASFVTDTHTLLAPALKTARLIELDGNVICSAELIRVYYSQL